MTACRNPENIIGKVSEAVPASVHSTSFCRARKPNHIDQNVDFFTLFDSAECPKIVKIPKGVHVKVQKEMLVLHFGFEIWADPIFWVASNKCYFFEFTNS